MLGPEISRPFPPLNLRPGIFISSRFPWILCMIVQRSGAEKKKVRSLLTFMNRSSIPPTPPYSHAPPPPPPRSAVAGHHSRSISQPAFFSLESLPPLTPVPYPKSSPTSSLSDSGDMPAPFSSPTVGVASPASAGLPPRKAHRRSTSDIPSGFFPTAPATVKREPGYDGAGERKSHGNVGDDMFDAFLNLEGIGAMESSDYRREEMDSRGSGNSKNCAYSSESEAESSAIECGGQIGEAARSTAPSRHFRSISMDGLMRRLSFDEESNRVPPSPGSKRRQSSHDDPMDGEFSLEFGNGEFSGTELKKIMSDKRLEEIALADPKRAKRILANRQSAARSKERKTRYISELERKVQTLQTEATTMSAQLTLLQRDSAGLANQNSELKIRLQAMEQQAQLRDALNEALSTEVQRLRLATAELDDSRPTQMKPATSIKS